MQRREGLRNYIKSYLNNNDFDILLSDDADTASIKFFSDNPSTHLKALIVIPTKGYEQPATDLERKRFDRILQYGLALHELGHYLFTPAEYVEEKFALSNFDPRLSELLKDIWNGLEDAGIEEAIRKIFEEGTAKRLDIKNRNIHEITSDGPHKQAVTVDRALVSATIEFGKHNSGMIDSLRDDQDSEWQWFSDEDQKLFEELYDDLVETVAAVQTTLDNRVRQDIIFEFLNSVNDVLGDYDQSQIDDEQRQSVTGTEQNDFDSNQIGPEQQSPTQLSQNSFSQIKQRLGGDSGEQSDDELDKDDPSEETESSQPERESEENLSDNEGGENSTNNDGSGEGEEEIQTEDNGLSEGQSTLADFENAEEDTGSEPGDAEATSPDDSPQRDSGDCSGDADSESSETPSSGKSLPDDESEVSASPELDTRGSPSGLPDEYDPASDDELLENEDSKLKAERQQGKQREQRFEQELAALKSAAQLEQGSSSSIDNVTICQETDGEFDPVRWAKAQQKKDTIGNSLVEALEEEQRDTYQQGMPSGKLDSRRVHQLPCGQFNIFQRRVEGDQKRYTVFLVLDRSSSMSPYHQDDSDTETAIEVAEISTVATALALEEAGIEVCIIDMYDDEARLVNPLSMPVEHSKEQLVTGETAGGTPLSEVLKLARRRAVTAGGPTFIGILTDGKPDEQQEYLEQLQGTPIPVIGFTLLLDRPDGTVPSKFQQQSQYYDGGTYIHSEKSLDGALSRLSYDIFF